MNLTVRTKKYGNISFDSDINVSKLTSSSSLLKLAYDLLDDFLDKAFKGPLADDYELVYDGNCEQKSTFTKKGVAKSIIYNIIEFMEENGLTVITTRDIVNEDLVDSVCQIN